MRARQLIIPCYNEQHRLDPDKVLALVDRATVGVILVDDGSKDGTLSVIRGLAERYPDAITALPTAKNAGKGEAVRAGLRHAINHGAQIVGYADADFSTPPAELLRLLNVLESSEHQVVLGTRLARLGSRIVRKRSRHYLGRVFATFAAVTLDLMVYDTQCGAKWFRVTDSLERALADPFRTRWVFDVELIGRMTGRFGKSGTLTPVAALYEEPLLSWRDDGGSKLSVAAMLKAFLDLLRLLLEARRRSR